MIFSCVFIKEEECQTNTVLKSSVRSWQFWLSPCSSCSLDARSHVENLRSITSLVDSHPLAWVLHVLLLTLSSSTTRDISTTLTTKPTPCLCSNPLEHGPIDFYHELRRLEEHGKFGKVFDWQGANYSGSGRPIHHISNDAHNRYNLTHIGSQGKRNYMDNIYNDLFGTPGFQNTEQRYVVPNPDRHRIYGGPQFLTHDHIGN